MKKDKIIEYSKHMLDSPTEKKRSECFQITCSEKKKTDDFANPFIKNQKEKEE